MNKLNKLRVALERMLLEYSHIATDKGILYYDGLCEDIAKGVNVYLENEDGTKVAAEAGSYETELSTIVVEGGRVSDIIEKEIEQPKEDKEDVKMEEQQPAAPAEEPAAEPAKEEVPAEEPKVEEVKAEPVAAEPAVDVVAELQAKVADFEAKKAEFEAKLVELEAKIAEKDKTIDELNHKPAAEPATADFEHAVTVEKTGNKGLDNLNAFLAAGRKK